MPSANQLFVSVAVFAVSVMLPLSRVPAAEQGPPLNLDDSPFCVQELFEPFEIIRNGKITNPVLVKGLGQPDGHGRSPEDIDAELFFDFIGRNARDLGIHWSRTDVTGGLWQFLIEREPGRYDWSGTDAVIMAQRKWGINLVCRISPGTAGNDAHRQEPPKPTFPDDIERYRRFVRTGVERYDGDGIDDAPGSPRVACWQIHNEPDGPQFWQDTPERFAQLHRITFEEIKAADPTAVTLLAGCATHEGLNRFFKPLLADLGRDGKHWFDIADLHFNQPEFWPSPQGDYRGLTRAVMDFRAELDKNGFDDAPIWITECGVYSNQPPAGGPFDQGPRGLLPLVTEHDHAADLVRRYVLALSLGVRKVFWNGMLERFAERGNGYFAHTGLIYDGRFDPPHVAFGEKKLAYYAYQKMVQMLRASDWDRLQVLRNGSDGVFCVRFPRKGTSGSVVVAWAAPSKEEKGQTDWPGRNIEFPVERPSNQPVAVVSVPLGQAGAGLSPQNLVFEEVPIQVRNGVGTITIGTTPVYIEF
jgi:hypothetical protein